MIMQTTQEILYHQAILTELGLLSHWNGFNLWVHTEPNKSQQEQLTLMNARRAAKRAEKNESDGGSRPVWYFKAADGLPKYIDGVC